MTLNINLNFGKLQFLCLLLNKALQVSQEMWLSGGQELWNNDIWQKVLHAMPYWYEIVFSAFVVLVMSSFHG